jgi:hypothetical protein
LCCWPVWQRCGTLYSMKIGDVGSRPTLTRFFVLLVFAYPHWLRLIHASISTALCLLPARRSCSAPILLHRFLLACTAVAYTAIVLVHSSVLLPSFIVRRIQHHLARNSLVHPNIFEPRHFHPARQLDAGRLPKSSSLRRRRW